MDDHVYMQCHLAFISSNNLKTQREVYVEQAKARFGELSSQNPIDSLLLMVIACYETILCK